MQIMAIVDYPSTKFEKLKVTVFGTGSEASIEIAREIAELIQLRQKKGGKAVLGLATGATPIGVYKELVRLHREEGLSFENVITFNLDEYYPIGPESVQSYDFYMRHHLFNHIDIPKENIHIPQGDIPEGLVHDHCMEYERKIDDAGGIDIQILGIGRTGHIGFNEPGSPHNSETRLVKLDPVTISDAKREFIKEEFVPRRAMTMGIRSIFKARDIYLLAWGERKAEVVRKAVEGEITDEIPASFLQNHPNVHIVLDKWASEELSRFKTPWLTGLCEWDNKLTKRAVIWLSQKLKKPVLKLTDEDYKGNELGELIPYPEASQELNVRIFNELQHTITGWPGGKPGTDDTHRPERALPAQKRVIIFSPHPDDDVISMGGTLLKLVEQGHEVHLAYQTSGNNAVFDDDALRFAQFASDIAEALSPDDIELSKLYKSIDEVLVAKKQGEHDPQIIKLIKGLIRKGEASAAGRYCGVAEKNIHFLNLPFYNIPELDERAISDKDIDVILSLIREIKPHQIFAAGDLKDPHGTHKLCLDTIFSALNKAKSDEWTKDCYLWLYRGAWHEWKAEEIEMAVPLSPIDVMKKRRAIFKHQSQKDTPVFPGEDKREFWQRAEDRNQQTARIYDLLGLTEYEGMEAFVRYHF